MKSPACLENNRCLEIRSRGAHSSAVSEIKLRTAVIVEFSTDLEPVGSTLPHEEEREKPGIQQTVVLTVYVPHCGLHPTRVQIVEI